MPYATRDLTGTVVAITGATAGIGAAAASQLVEAGAKVVLGGRREERLDEAVASGRYPEPTVPAATYDTMVAAEDPWLRSNRNAAALRTVQSPVLVMVGRRDVITPPANSRALADLLPKAQLLRVPAAGHSVLFQAPQESATAITAFLDGARASLTWPCA